MNVGAYITTLNEERLIKPCLKAMLEVFPQTEIIDLGSKDATLDIISEFKIPIHSHIVNEGLEYTLLKNKYAQKHDWVVLIDGDEIFPKESLELIKARIGDTKYYSVQNFWKLIKEENGEFFISSIYRGGGRKAFDTKVWKFCQPWPEEVLGGTKYSMHWSIYPEKESRHTFNGIFCWHGVLLKRSSISCNNLEEKIREEKRQDKLQMYNRAFEWEKIDKLPWE